MHLKQLKLTSSFDCPPNRKIEFVLFEPYLIRFIPVDSDVLMISHLEVHNLLKPNAAPLIIKRNGMIRKIEFACSNLKYETDIRVAGELVENVQFLFAYEEYSRESKTHCIYVECVDIRPSSIQTRWTQIIDIPFHSHNQYFRFKLFFIDRDNYIVFIVKKTFEEYTQLIYHVVLSKETVEKCQYAERFNLASMSFGVFEEKLVIAGELQNMPSRSKLKDQVIGYFSREAHIFKPVCLYGTSQGEDWIKIESIEMNKINFSTYSSEEDPFKFKLKQIDIRQLLDLVNDDDKEKNSAPGAVLTEHTLPIIALCKLFHNGVELTTIFS